MKTQRLLVVACLLGCFVARSQGGYAQQCIASTANCTANDLPGHTVVVLGSSSDLSCTDGDGLDLDLLFTSSTTATRYDIALLLTQDGDPIPGNGTDCSARVLTTDVDTNNDGIDDVAADPIVSPTDGSDPNGPYPDEDLTPDDCGDVTSGFGWEFLWQNATIPCVDNDGNGNADFDVCWFWNNSTAGGNDLVCDEPTDITEGTSAKCWCGSQNDAFVDVGVPLPVELSLFEGTVREDVVLLTWATESETNNAGFSVEHAYSSESFTEAGFVQGFGSTLLPNRYSFEMSSLKAGLHKFRLKQIDFDGSFAYSSVVELTVHVPGRFLLNAAYPNPFNPTTIITFMVAESSPVRVDAYDAIGGFVKALYAGTPEANTLQSAVFDGSNLPSGTYVVRIEGVNFSGTQEVVLLK